MCSICLFSSIHLFTQSLVSVWIHGFLLYPLDYGPIILYFVAQIVSSLVVGHSFSWPLCSFVMPHHLFFKHFLIFWHHRMLLAHFIYSLYHSQNQPFLQGALTNVLLIHLSWRMTAHLSEGPSSTKSSFSYSIPCNLYFKLEHSKCAAKIC